MKSKIKVGKCRIDIEPLVLIQIHGQPDPGGLPYIANDGGLVVEFLRYLADSKIRGHHVSSGGGEYTGYFTEANAKLVEQWFREHEEADHDPA